jgi:PHD/YefM family antitoxin component YafN of YafNO toxin-antitoxin module
MDKSVVDTLYDEYKRLTEFLLKNNEPSYFIIVENSLRKNLILASSSYFEHSITTTILNYFQFLSKENVLLTEFVKNKAISRQFHTYFNWNDSNANSFFGLFGPNFLAYMKSKIKSDEKLVISIKDFLELGGERNRIVHQNFASYNIDKTADEIFNAYKSARYFIDRFDKYLKQEI